MPEKEDPLQGDVRGRGSKQGMLDEEVIYDASERGNCYNCVRILWCGCFEPYAHITTKYAKEDRWEGCKKIADSMAFENIKDVRRQQTCCCLMARYSVYHYILYR